MLPDTLYCCRLKLQAQEGLFLWANPLIRMNNDFKTMGKKRGEMGYLFKSSTSAITYKRWRKTFRNSKKATHTPPFFFFFSFQTHEKLGFFKSFMAQVVWGCLSKLGCGLFGTGCLKAVPLKSTEGKLPTSWFYFGFKERSKSDVSYFHSLWK